MRDPIDEIREALAHPDFLERIDAIRGYDVAEKRLLDRLEAAESARRDDYQNWMTALDRNAELLAKLEAAEKERDEFKRECFGHISDNSLLRAKVEAMEKQEPVASVWRCDNGHIHGSCERTLPMGTKLYALPGAKGEEK